MVGLLGILGYLVLMAVTNPWIYTVGGRVRLWPSWEGVGDIQGPGGNYRIFLSLEPSSSRSRVPPSTSIRGTGWICAPSEHNYEIRLGGGSNKVVWRDMNNESFSLHTWHRTYTSTEHLPPKLSLVGRWVGDTLVMEDKGTAAAAFLADGSLAPQRGKPGASSAITFVETQWWFGRPCPSGGN
jgi:hypothetical protein